VLAGGQRDGASLRNGLQIAWITPTVFGLLPVTRDVFAGMLPPARAPSSN
jgi:hypothetical protein